MANTRSRGYQLTFNNPEKHNITHDVINDLMKNLKWEYYCMCDEIGEKEQTSHTHLYFYCKNAVYFDRIKKLFPTAHIEQCKGTSQDNRDYIRKEGRHADKNITSLPDTFEEYGEMPLDTKTKNDTVSAEVLSMIEDGYSNANIIREHPSYMTKINQLDSARKTLLQEKFKENFRNVEVFYIFGNTGTGKTRYVMDTYGYREVYKVSNYKNPFDNYISEDVLLLDEFRSNKSNISISDLLQYLDVYPCRLPARYNDTWACYTKVFIISNIDLKDQYTYIQKNEKESYNALIRRIKKITKFEKNENGETIKIDIPTDYYLLEV